MNITRLDDFDPADYLDNAESIQAYIDEAVATGDAAFISQSLGVIARAKGMNTLAEETGLSRETLYRTLSVKGNPNLKTLIYTGTYSATVRTVDIMTV
ncbi:addiction module antidote protein [Vibrio anguillarum]